MGGTNREAISPSATRPARRVTAAGGITTQAEIDDLDAQGVDAVVRHGRVYGQAHPRRLTPLQWKFGGGASSLGEHYRSGRSEAQHKPAPEAAARVVTDGKFLRIKAPQSAGERFLVKGVTYGTVRARRRRLSVPSSAPGRRRLPPDGGPWASTRSAFTPPPRRDLLDDAAAHGLRVMVGLPWSQHVAFLDDRAAAADDPAATSPARSASSATIRPSPMFALGNEIPPSVVRWHGRLRVERFLRRSYQDAKAASPEQPVHLRQLPADRVPRICPFFDVCAFNVYLHREPELRAYLARLQHIAGHKPLLLAEAGADSIREGEEGQAAITAMHMRAALRGRRVRRDRVRVDRRVVARRLRRRRLGVRPRRSPMRQPEAGGRRGRDGVRRRAVPAAARAALAARVGRRLRLQRRRHARGLPRARSSG